MNKFALTVENLTKIYSNSKTKKHNKALNQLNGFQMGANRLVVTFASNALSHILGRDENADGNNDDNDDDDSAEEEEEEEEEEQEQEQETDPSWFQSLSVD